MSLPKHNAAYVLMAACMHLTLEHDKGQLPAIQNAMHCTGSERVGKSEATGDRLEEAKHINKSLSALGKAMGQLPTCCAFHITLV